MKKSKLIKNVIVSVVVTSVLIVSPISLNANGLSFSDLISPTYVKANEEPVTDVDPNGEVDTPSDNGCEPVMDEGIDTPGDNSDTLDEPVIEEPETLGGQPEEPVTDVTGDEPAPPEEVVEEPQDENLTDPEEKTDDQTNENNTDTPAVQADPNEQEDSEKNKALEEVEEQNEPVGQASEEEIAIALENQSEGNESKSEIKSAILCGSLNLEPSDTTSESTLQEGHTLPNTATNAFNILSGGLLAMLTGLVGLFTFEKKRNQYNDKNKRIFIPKTNGGSFF